MKKKKETLFGKFSKLEKKITLRKQKFQLRNSIWFSFFKVQNHNVYKESRWSNREVYSYLTQESYQEVWILKECKPFKRVSSTAKLFLIDENILEGLCFQHLESIDTFSALIDHVYIEENWFHNTNTFLSYYITLNEEDPRRECKNKKFIITVIFLSVVVRHRWDPHKKKYFDGKFDMYKQNLSKEKLKKRILATKIIKTIDKKEI